MYRLLPFNFTRIAGQEVLVNEVGDMQIVPNGTVGKIVEKKLGEKSELYKTPKRRVFLTSILHYISLC